MTSFQVQAVWRRWVKQSLREAGWAPLSVFVTHVIALLAFDAYTAIASADLVMHFIGGMVMAFFLHRASINAARMGIMGAHHQITHRILVFTSTCTVALFWEFGEFTLDQVFGTFSQPSLRDTFSDLLFGTLGAAVFILATAAGAACSRAAASHSAQKAQDIKNAVPGD
jgi:hypothetical protein